MKEINETPYGSDATGLIWGHHFRPRLAATVISAQSAHEWLSGDANRAPGEFIWLHFSLANSATANWLRRHLQLPDTFYDSFHPGTGATRLEQEQGCLVAVMHDVRFDLSFDPSAVSSGHVYVDSRCVISTRLRPLRSIEELRRAVREGALFESPVALLAHLLSDQANVLMQVLRHSTARVDVIEDRLLANRIATSRAELGNLRRVLVRLQRMLAPEPASFFRLLNRPPHWINTADLRELRQAAEEAAVGDTQALIERVKLLQEELAAQVNEQTNRTLHILTLVTVLALPINMVAGLFGMNVGGNPMEENSHGFAIVVCILALLTGLLAFRTLRRSRDG